MNEEPRAWSFRAFGLVLLAVGAAAALALVLWSRAGGEPSSPEAQGGGGPAVTQDGISASADFRPRIALFGDTLVARVDAVVDPSVVDPETVKVSWDPAPWTPVAVPHTNVERAGSSAHVRASYILRCLAAVCAPARETERIDLEPARVTYTTIASGERSPQSADIPWPTLVVHTQVGELDPSARDALAAPWRADFASLPAVSYRVDPWVAVAVLVALGGLLLVIAGVAVYRAWPRRQPEPEPEPEPELVASVLEQALELLENEVSADGVEERRRALELVADEVEHLGDEELALSAREMAWSPVSPEAERTRALAADLRVRFADVLAEMEAARSNGAPGGRVNGGPS